MNNPGLMHNTLDLAALLTSLPALLQKINNPAGRESFGPLTAQPFALVNLNSETNHPDDYRVLAGLFSALPCPLIGFYPEQALVENDPARKAMINALDLVVDKAQDLRTILTNIKRSPIAAMTLVQLIRNNARATIDDGLLAESLAYATLQGGSEFQRYLKERPTLNTSPDTGNEAPVLLTKTVLNDNSATAMPYRLDITLNRPQQRNAYNAAMRDALVDALHLLNDDPSIEQARISGAGSCFCIGGDLTEFGLCQDTTLAHAIRSTRNAGKLISLNAERIHCHVHRACIGSGIELPAFANTLSATENTFFQLPEITMGLIPGAGGTVSITRRIGRQRMNWLALSAKRINARTALEWGLIDAIREESLRGNI